MTRERERGEKVTIERGGGSDERCREGREIGGREGREGRDKERWEMKRDKRQREERDERDGEVRGERWEMEKEGGVCAWREEGRPIVRSPIV